MVGQWDRLDAGSVLHAVYPCLRGSETVLHPWNAKRGTYHLNTVHFRSKVSISKNIFPMIIIILCVTSWIAFSLFIYYVHSALLSWPLLPLSYQKPSKSKRSFSPSLQLTVTASLRQPRPLRTVTSLLMKKSRTVKGLRVETIALWGIKGHSSTLTLWCLTHSQLFLQYLTGQSAETNSTDTELKGFLSCWSFLHTALNTVWLHLLSFLKKIPSFLGELVIISFCQWQSHMYIWKKKKNMAIVVTQWLRIYIMIMSAFWGSIFFLLWTSLMFS